MDNESKNINMELLFGFSYTLSYNMVSYSVSGRGNVTQLKLSFEIKYILHCLIIGIPK